MGALKATLEEVQSELRDAKEEAECAWAEEATVRQERDAHAEQLSIAVQRAEQAEARALVRAPAQRPRTPAYTPHPLAPPLGPHPSVT